MNYKEITDGNCGIYAIRNTVNGKIYVGQSRNITWRWASHKSTLRSGRCPNRHLQAAWSNYGEKSFEFYILETCDIDSLDSKEEYWIEKLNTVAEGYNIRPGGNSSRGWIMSGEGRKHISDALKGKKKPEWMGRYISERQKEYYKTHIPSTSKQVVCLNTGEIFANASMAHMQYPTIDTSALHQQCKGKTKSCGKSDNGERLVWAYLEDYQCMTSGEIACRLEFVGRLASSSANMKSVKCLNTGIVFSSCKDAAEYAGISKATIHDCLSGRQKHAGKHPESGERLSWAWANA